MKKFDIGVLGLGAMGSAATLAIATRGARVVAFDQHRPPHVRGSTHGHTRIIREAYYEHPLYVPLVRRAFELWERLAAESGTPLLLQTGGLMVGRENGPIVRGARESADRHGIAHEMLDAAALASRFPAYRARADRVALLERRAGLLFPERCIESFHAQARRAGATLQLGERVESWARNSSGMTLRTDRASYTVGRLVVAAGPWLPELSDALGVALPLEIERQLSHWFRPSGDAALYRAERCPIALWETEDDGELFATIPDEGHGVKCGMHHAGQPTSPRDVDRLVSDAENELARRLLEQVMPGAGGPLLESRVCLYTNTPDRHFVIDWCDSGRVLLLSPCSGHGFKFASAIGEVAAQLLLDGRSWIDLEPFSLSRFR